MERLGVVLLLCAGCFQPAVRDGQISCELEELCPTGFVCLDGLCRNQSPDTIENDPADPDAGSPDPDPDAGTPAVGPKIYRLVGGSWTTTAAAGYFAGAGLDAANITNAWSHCGAGLSLRCFSDDTNIACHDGAVWAKAPWGEIDNSLATFKPTFTTSYLFSPNEWVFEPHRGEDWRGYEGLGPTTSGGALSSRFSLKAVSGQNGFLDLDQAYDNDPNAPSAFDDVVADYMDTTEAGDPWSFLVATGYRFTSLATGGSTGDQEPTLALPGAPLAADIKAADMCEGALLFYATN